MLNVSGFVTMVKCLRLSSTGQRQCLRLKRLMELMCVSLECMCKNMVLTVLSPTIGKQFKRETFKQLFEQNYLYITFGRLMYLFVSALSTTIIFFFNISFSVIFRRVYISYLDSVHFFQPRQLRTAVYHEILIGYLEYVKLQGYSWAHIWACPPSEGDDYIFHCHPPEQKIPKPKRLQEWYKKMLDKAIIERCVIDYKVTYFFKWIFPHNDCYLLIHVHFF